MNYLVKCVSHFLYSTLSLSFVHTYAFLWPGDTKAVLLFVLNFTVIWWNVFKRNTETLSRTHFWRRREIYFHCENDHSCAIAKTLEYRLNTVGVIDFIYVSVSFLKRSPGNLWHFFLKYIKKWAKHGAWSEFCVDICLWSCSRKLSFFRDCLLCENWDRETFCTTSYSWHFNPTSLCNTAATSALKGIFRL